MKFLVCGLGSMGKRRIRLLKQIAECESIVGFDLNQERCDTVSKEYGISCYSNLDIVDNDSFDSVVISTSPLSHYEIAKKMLQKRKHVFTEINLVSDWYDDCLQIANNNNVKLFLSSTLNYRKDIEYIREAVNTSKCKSSYIYHVGQYLPDWHPWESYKSFFVNDKRTNGCREIFAIDLPWIVKTFGDVKSFNVVHSKISNLDLNYDDLFILTLEHTNGNVGTILVDVVSRKAVRTLEVINEDFHINWQGKPDSLEIYNPTTKETCKVQAYDVVDKNSNYSSNIIENAYLDELVSFVKYINGLEKPIYDFDDDKKVISLIDKIEA